CGGAPGARRLLLRRRARGRRSLPRSLGLALPLALAGCIAALVAVAGVVRDAPEDLRRPVARLNDGLLRRRVAHLSLQAGQLPVVALDCLLQPMLQVGGERRASA